MLFFSLFIFFSLYFQEGTASSTTEYTARIQNDGLTSDNAYIDDDGSGLAPDESSGSGWGGGPGPDDEDDRGGSGDAPSGDNDDEDFKQPTTTRSPVTEIPWGVPDVSDVPAVPENYDNSLDSLVPESPFTDHPLLSPDQTFNVIIPRILKPSEGAVDTGTEDVGDKSASGSESDISISGEDESQHPNIDHEPAGSNRNSDTQAAPVDVIMNEDRATSFFAQPGILAAVIGGAVVGLLCAILVVMFIVYRMRKKDEGSYALDEPKRSPAAASYGKGHNNREFYA
ncbi:hypothetical protein ACJJTC_015608 [Scirpophaga incertulas]